MDVLTQNIDLYNKALDIVCMQCKLKTLVKIYPLEFSIGLCNVYLLKIVKCSVRLGKIQTF